MRFNIGGALVVAAVVGAVLGTLLFEACKAVVSRVKVDVQWVEAGHGE